MTTTINASPSNGLVQTADGSGILKVQSNGKTTNALAWVNWDGLTSPYTTVRASYNVSSITYNGTGDWIISFTSALTDANAICIATTGYNYLAKSSADTGCAGLLSTTQAWYENSLYTGSNRNAAVCQMAVFGN